MNALVLFALTITPEGYLFRNERDADVLSLSEAVFADGVRHRNNDVAARKRFTEAARGYDELWSRGFRTPELAINRARAHRLAGNLPGAVAAARAGYAAAPHDRILRQELASARAAVAYPPGGSLAAECRVPPHRSLRTILSPTEVWLITLGLWAAACAAAVRFAITRAVTWLVMSGVALVAIVAFAAVWHTATGEDERFAGGLVAVVAAESQLRTGNGASYPARRDEALPPGVEVRELVRRGGWVQVELAGGTVGWLPEAALCASSEQILGERRTSVR